MFKSISSMSDTELNRALGALMGDNVYSYQTTLNGLTYCYEKSGSMGKRFLPSKDMACAKLVMDTAIAHNPDGYIISIARIQGWEIGSSLTLKDAARVANASPREIAKASLITLQGDEEVRN